MNILMHILLILVLLIIPLASQTQVTIYSASDYPPYSYIQKHGQLRGIHVDILKSIFSKMKNYHLNLRSINWTEGLEKIEKGEIFILSNAYYRPKKRPYIVNYSDAYSYELPSIYCNKKINIKDKQNINWQEDFRGLTIAKQKNSSITSSDAFQKAIKDKNIKIVEHEHNQENLKALINDEVDCYINDNLTVQGELLQKQKEYLDLNQSTQKLDKIQKVAILMQEGVHLAFSKKYFAKRTDLIKKINLAIKVMKNSGEIEKIEKNYLVDFFTQDHRHNSINASIFPLGSFISDEMSNYGLLAEIVTTAFADRNITINYHYSSKNEAYLYNKWGKSCMSFPWTKGVDSWLYNELSDPIMTSYVNFFYEKNNLPEGIEYRNLYDLKDYHIGGINGAFYENFFQGMSFDYHSFDNTKLALIALTLKKIDILPMNRHLFVDALKLYMPYKMENFAHHAKPMTQKANYILFSKNCSDAKFFRDEFNKGFVEIQKNGIFDEILAKYTTSKQEKEEFEKIFRNLEKVVEAEEVSVFDINQTKHSDLNQSDLEITDSNITIDEANISKKTT